MQSTGKALSAWQAEGRQGGLGFENLLFLGLDPGLEALEARIKDRANAMLEAGWAQEARLLAQRHGKQAVLATGAIGYGQAFGLLEGGLSKQEALDSIILATRQYARRQRTWFRRLPGIHWLQGSHLLGQALKLVEGP
jgi:tRNA dimethylallyltransferase